MFSFIKKIFKGSLSAACYKGNIESVKQHIAAGTDLNAQYHAGFTPLQKAAEYGHKEVVELLIANGAYVNGKHKNGSTSLHYAAWRGEKEITELLITKRADVNAKDENGQTPLHDAAVHKEIAELLIVNGADVNAKVLSGAKQGKTPLDFIVARQGGARSSWVGWEEAASLLRKHGGKTGEELKAGEK
jgi:ankyrin repeat protein